MTQRNTGLKQRCADLVGIPCTALECADILEADYKVVSATLCNLAAEGRVVQVALKRSGRRGRLSKVWGRPGCRLAAVLTIGANQLSARSNLLLAEPLVL